MDLLQPRGPDGPLIITAPSVPPYTTPALTANLVLRIVLAILGNLVCLAPLRLLWRNSELAAVIFIVNVELRNLQTVVFALIWPNDDVDNWWPGYGLCDGSAYFQNFTIALFATCMLAITRNLAHQVGLMRAHPLTVKEKRRRNIVQALIMFPLPIIQLAFTWFVTAQRYAIAPLVGCTWVAYSAWPFLVFFVLAPVIVSLMTVGYAILCYFRFRQVSKTMQTALSSNRAANHRAQRTRRRLYLMIISILVPFFPIIVTLCVLNLVDMGPLQPFDYDRIHNSANPYPWNSIVYLRSDQIGFGVLNIGWIPILTTFPIFIFFGTTKDAINDYRRMALGLSLGRFWPRLYEEYDPDRAAGGSGSFGSTSSQGAGIQSGSGYMSLKFRTTTSTDPFSTISSHTDDTIRPHQPLNFLTQSSQEAGHVRSQRLASNSTTTTLHEGPQRPQHSYDTTIHRNPFLMRTHMDFTNFRLPNFFKSSKPSPQATTHLLQPLQPTDPSGSTHTRVWSDEEDCRLRASNDNSRRSASSDQEKGVHVETSFTSETHRTQQR